jgi:outer membrane protein insertion porin family
MRIVRLSLGILITVLVAPALHAQAASPPGELTIGRIDIRFQGSANVSEQVVRANMQVREGVLLDEVMIDRDIRSLYRTGQFEFIEVKREVRADGVVNLLFEVTSKFRVLSIRYDGNERVRDRRLEREVETKPNLALDERQVKEDAEKIREYYQKSGYNQVSVYYEIERDRASGFGTVVFKIEEGPKVRVSGIKFAGNENVKSRRLRKEMETKRWWMFSWLTGSGRFKDEDFEDDLDKLRDYYREEGYLDVQVRPEQISFDYPSPDRLIITITVNEGRRYSIGEVEITGAEIYPSGLLGIVLKQRSGMVFSPSKLDEDVKALEDFYGREGYLETRVRLLRKPNLATSNIDLEYQVNESEQFNVESIKIEGNTKTKSIVILRELVLGPGEVFNTVRMEFSKLRLENTRFFEDVNVSPEITNIPGRRNLKVAIKEGRTGNLTFGAGFSSLERAVVFAELSQSNFDLFNRRSFFQGDGQKFRLRLQLGSESSEAVMSFEEPWLFERQLALGFTLYRTASDFNSALFSEIRTGGEVYLRKRLFELVDGRLSYTYEIVDIGDVDPSLSDFFTGDERVTSKVGFQFLRDTRDKIINTTRGNRFEFNTEIAGGVLGGDWDYYKLEARGSQFFPLFETQTQVLSLIGRAGVIDAFGDSAEVPFFDRFYLGGPTDLRGFEYRQVGPKNNLGEPVGGGSYGFLSIEYSLDIVAPIRFAIFYDAGFVNTDAYDFSPARYNDNFGFGLRLFVAGAPLSLDFGIPLTADDQNNEGNQFNFSFGTRF